MLLFAKLIIWLSLIKLFLLKQENMCLFTYGADYEVFL